MGISFLSKKRFKNFTEAAISDDVLQCGYLIDFYHFDILASETDTVRLLTKESLFINVTNPVLNRTFKSFPLTLFD